MMQNTLLISCVVVVVLAWFYILVVREVLVATWPDKFSRWHEVEDKLWANSRNILIARIYIIGSIIIAIHDVMAAQGIVIDWTPLITQITNVIPEPYRPFTLSLWLALTGIAWEWLRRQTTGPVTRN